MPSRALVLGLVLALGASSPAFAQGKSQEPHGNGGGGRGNGNGNGGGSSSGKNTPSQSLLQTPASSAAPAGTSPFAWLDNASLMTPGTLWIGASTVRWQGAGASEVSIPVIDAAVGVSPRLQLGVSTSRVSGSSDPSGPSGGFGTTFVNAKIAVFRSDAHGVSVAVTPTLEILSRAAMEWAPADQSRAQWGLPVSVDLEAGPGRLYASAGHFTPGVWFAGAGAGMPLAPRVGLALSFSHAWSSMPSADDPGLTVAAPHRNDLSASVSVEVLPQVGVFGAIGRTIATGAEDGAGTTFSAGFSWTGRAFTRPAALPRD